MNNNLIPEIPVLKGYDLVKNQISQLIKNVNEFEVITIDNEKEVKKAIAEINKIKDKISRYRIDNTNAFMANIQNYVDKCKELEKMCTDGVSAIKTKVSELEEKERQNKIDMLEKLYEAITMNYGAVRNQLSFDLFYEKSMSNKSTSLTVVENQMKTWAENKENDLRFILNNCDEPAIVIANYKTNGLQLTQAINSYQERFKSEAEIKAMIANENKPAQQSFEKVLDVCIKIKQLPKSKVAALQSFLDSLKVEFEVEVM